jgi:hypothetical protein
LKNRYLFFWLNRLYFLYYYFFLPHLLLLYILSNNFGFLFKSFNSCSAYLVTVLTFFSNNFFIFILFIIIGQEADCNWDRSQWNEKRKTSIQYNENMNFLGNSDWKLYSTLFGVALVEFGLLVSTQMASASSNAF